MTGLDGGFVRRSGLLVLALLLLGGGCGPGDQPSSILTLAVAPGGGGVQPLIKVDGTWEPQGPAPIQGAPGDIAGAVQAVAAHPTDPNIVYVGAVNGGIWRTATAKATPPTWTSQGNALPSPSIGALAFDPADAMTLIAGVGRFSSFQGVGGPLGFIYHTVDGGVNWRAINPAILAGANISAVAARGNTLLATSSAGTPGLFRSMDVGTSWVQVADAAASNGLPLGATTDLVGDPRRSQGTWFYTAVLGAGASSSIFFSQDTGASWLDATTGSSAGAMSLRAAIQDASASDCRLSVGQNGRVFAAVYQNMMPAWIGYIAVDGSWMEMEIPEAAKVAGAHFAIAADPNDEDRVYLAVAGPQLFRGDVMGDPQWQAVTPGDPTPRGDPRALAFDMDGALLQGDGGGVYKREAPQGAGDWTSLNGDLQIAEFHAAAYDAVSNVIIASSQDGGVATQVAPDGMAWMETLASGGDVAVNDTAAASIRYVSSRNTQGQFVLKIVDGPDTPLPDLLPQVITPIELGAIDQNRMVIDQNRMVIGAANGLYESTAVGLPESSFVLVPRSDSDEAVVANAGDAIAYGADGAPDVLYVGSESSVFVREPGATGLTPSGYPGQVNVRGIALDPGDWRTAYVCDDGAVYHTADAGASWTPISGDLQAVATAKLGTNTLVRFHCIEYVPAAAGGAVVVGCDAGVFASQASALGTWIELGAEMPNILVWDLDYDATDDVLVAGTLGRGAWKLRGLAGTAPNEVDPILTLDKTALAFGDVDENTTSAPMTVMIGNIAAATKPLIVTDLTTTNGEFEVTAPTTLPTDQAPLEIQPGTMVPVMVTYTPSAVGDDPGEMLTITHNAVGSPSTVALTGRGVIGMMPDIDVNPALPFGPVETGTIRDLPLEIRNVGNAPLNVTALTFGAGSKFSSAQALPLMIAAGAAMAVTVRYSPTTLGPDADTLQIASDDPDEAVVPVALTGMSVVGMMPDIDVNPALPFGPVETGTIRDLPLEIRNVGNAPLNVTALTFGAGSKFSSAQALPLMIAAGAAMAVTVRYSPTTLGPDADTLQIASDDPDEAVVPVSLTGMSVVGMMPDIDVNLALPFGPVETGTIRDLPLEIRNMGNAPLNVTALTFGAGSKFSSAQALPLMIAAGAAMAVTVRYSPTTLGPDADTLQIASDDPDEAVVPVSLTGMSVVGMMPDIDVNPALPFGPVETGTIRDLPLEIRNVGNAPLNVTALTFGAGSKFSSAQALPLMIAAGAAMAVTVRYSPTTLGPDADTLQIASDDPDEAVVPVALTGMSVVGMMPDIDVNLALPFGPVETGTIRDLPLEIRNVGNAPLNVTALTFGAGSKFSSAQALPLMIAAGAAMAVTVRYSPTTLGPDADTLQIASDDPDEAVVPVALTGMSVVGMMPDIDVNPALPFGPVETGTIRDLPLEIRNLGTAPLDVTTLTFSAGSEFSSAQALPLTIAAGAAMAVTVRYSPTTLGPDADTLQIASNDPDEPVVLVALTGMSVVGMMPDIDVNLALPFGGVRTGTNLDLPLEIRNLGTAPLEVTALTFGAGSKFSSAQAPLTIPAGASMDVTVRYSPTTPGPDADTLQIASDDPDEPIVTVVLSGTGVEPNLEADPAALAFGDVTVNTTSDRMVTLRNTGAVGLNVTALSIQGSAEFSTTTPVSINVPAGSMMTVMVRYAPIDEGEDAGSLEITSDDPDTPVTSVPLTGKGVPDPTPNILLDPNALAFGEVTVGMTRDLTVAVRNTGNASLRVTALTFAGSAQFSSPTPASFTVPAFGRANVTVRFAPTAVGPDAGTLTVVSDDPDTPMAAVDLTGTGKSVQNCTDRSTCDGQLHEAIVETDVWVGTAAELEMSATFLNGFSYNSPEIDKVEATWTGAFPGPMTGLQDVLTVESVVPNGDGTVRVRLRITADASAFPGDSFGTAVKRCDVTINGRCNVGIATFVAAEIREGARFSWNPRCGDRPPCPLPMPVPATCPERFEPRFLATGNVGLIEWLRCKTPAPRPQAVGTIRSGPSR